MTKSPLIIGIAGGTGSGKTTVVNNIIHELNTASLVVISQDNYYKDLKDRTYQERVKVNFDHPQSIDFELLCDHIRQLKNGETIEQPIYSFVTHSRTEDSVHITPKEVIIVEGILVLTQKELRDLFDLKIFIHADSDERLVRRIRRDIQDRGRDLEEVLSRYQETLKPMHEQFIEPSKNYADIIVPNMNKNKAAVRMLSMMIDNRLNTKA